MHSIEQLGSLCGRVVWAREQAGVSTSRLSIISGLARTHLYKIESGERGSSLSFVTVEKLARTLGVSTDWLTQGTGDTPTQEQIARAVAVAEEAHRSKPSEDKRTVKSGTEG